MEANFNLDHPGKGQSVWMTLGYILSERYVYAVATHDCDIVNYHREMLARLVYPVVHPATEFEFSKGYYARVTAYMQEAQVAVEKYHALSLNPEKSRRPLRVQTPPGLACKYETLSLGSSDDESGRLYGGLIRRSDL